MRAITFLLFLAPTLLWGQICNEPSPVSYTGFGAQQTESDYFAGSDFLDGLNNSSYWSLGTGISDNNLAIWSNADVHTFLGVKARNTTAPNDNVSADGNTYLVEPGYSLASQNGSVGTGPESNWNILMYAGLDAGAFDSVDVIMHIDFDPCFDYTLEDMYSINIGSAFDGNPLTAASSFSSFGINTNMGSSEIAALNPAGTGFDATIEGYYTFAIQVLDNCGNQKLWNEITVYVQSTTTSGGDAVADANGNNVYDDNEVVGCANAAACNYDCAATTNEGCEYTSCSGCTVEDACNYNSEATIEDTESCDYPLDLYGASHFDCAGACLNDADGDDVCDEDEVVGCQDNTGCNYNAAATDAGSCTYPATHYDCAGDCLNDADGDGICDELEVDGCTSSSACNYDSSATDDDGSCETASCAGCTVVNACNYDDSKSISDLSSCVYAAGCDSCSGATDGTGTVVDGDTDNDGVCNANEVAGCTTSSACNYNSAATDDDGSCATNDALGVCGGSCSADADGDGICDDAADNCVDTAACNYDDAANEVCESVSCAGCTVDTACNYDDSATISSDTCNFATGCDSCSGAQDGSGTIVDGDTDNDGVCNANEVVGCTSSSACNYSSAATDDDGSCATNDALGVCGGTCSADADNDGICDDADNCVDTSACNYNDSANEACESLSCAGCTVDSACNYDDAATISLDTCTYATGCDSCSGAQDGSGTIVDGDTDNDGVCNDNEVSGCTTSSAANFNPLATDDDGSCQSLYGCMIGTDCNYNDLAVYFQLSDCSPANGGSTACSGDMMGSPTPLGLIVDCTIPSACNYNEEGPCEWSSCIGCTNEAGCDYDVDNLYSAPCDYTCYGCTNVNADNYDATSTIDDNSCVVSGCTTVGACNYDSTATTDDGSCEVTSCVGCNTVTACNYDSSVTLNEPISCVYATGCDSCSGASDGTGTVIDGDADNDGVCDTDEVTGCSDASACNYNSAATDDDGSCQTLDACGVCGGTGVDTDNDGVCDANEIDGCTISSACNYNSAATENTGCDFTSCVGCMVSSACNYDASATLNEPISCVYATGCDSCSDATDGSGTVVDGDTDNDGVCDVNEVNGCTDSSACNYDNAATNDDGSCLALDACGVCGGAGVDTDSDGVCDANEVEGCMNSGACNYDATATDNAGCDFVSCVGCMDTAACNFDSTATLNQLLDCVYAVSGYDCSGSCNTDTDSDGVCDEFEVAGCTDGDACNYASSATDDDGSCTYPVSSYVDCSGNCLVDDDEDGVCDQEEVYGCTITSACNYALGSTENDGSCEFSSCAGCTIESACNYDATATLSNNISCTYIPAGWDDCDQTICTDSDNDGNCDFDEVAGCVGEFGAPHILLSGMLELATPVADWAANDYSTSTSDATGVEGITWVDYAGRLNDGRYSVTRIYTATDVCGNSSEAGQLLIANENSASGCTNASATNYDASAVNDNGLCDYSPACLGDLNLDSIVGTSDLLILLSSFGLPCPE